MNDVYERSIQGDEVSHYASIGSVRGDCGHKHRSPRTAMSCTARDQRACRQLPGRCYSDRSTYLVLTDGTQIDIGWNAEG